MAKQQRPKVTAPPKTPSLMDFSEENLLGGGDDGNDLTNQDEPEVIEEEEEEQPVVVVPKKQTPKATPTKTAPVKSAPVVQQEPEIEEEQEEQEEVKEEEEQTEDDSKVFFEKVSSITGMDLNVDFGETDPLSPQGIALRDKALIDKTVSDFVAKLADELPEVHQALEYAYAGGDIQDLFKGEKDYSKMTLMDDDEAHATQILTDYYQKRGFKDESRIKRMIAAEQDSEEGVVGAAKLALAEMVEEQAAEKQEKILAAQEEQKEQRARDQKFLGSVNELLKSGQLSGFKIANQAEAGQFFDFVRSSVQRDGKGGYMIVHPIDPTQLEKQLQAEYFRYKKGDLSQLVQIKANSLNAEKLRLRVGGGDKTVKTTVAEEREKRTLRDF